MIFRIELSLLVLRQSCNFWKLIGGAERGKDAQGMHHQDPSGYEFHIRFGPLPSQYCGCSTEHWGCSGTPKLKRYKVTSCIEVCVYSARFTFSREISVLIVTAEIPRYSRCHSNALECWEADLCRSPGSLNRIKVFGRSDQSNRRTDNPSRHGFTNITFI